MSAEELKDNVRKYADEHLPGWEVAGVSFRVGPIVANAEEMLLVTPTRPEVDGVPPPQFDGTPD